MAPSQPDSADPQTPDAGEQNLSLAERLAAAAQAARGWITANRAKAAMILGGSLLVVGAIIGAGIYFAASSGVKDQKVTLEMALDALDRRALVKAQELAHMLTEQGSLAADELGGPAFVEGVALALETDERWEKDKTSTYLVAARYLEEARDRGFPPAREADGLFQLGRCLFLSGQYTASRSILRETLESNPQRQTEIHRMLAAAAYRDANPRLEEALTHNQLYLEDRLLEPTDRHEALLQRSQILFDLSRIDECRQILDKIPDDSVIIGEVTTVRGRLLMRSARELKEQADRQQSDEIRKQSLDKYREAIQAFRRAQGRDTLRTGATRKAMYLIALCQAEMGDRQAAQIQAERTRKLYSATPEGLACGLLSANLLRELERHDEAIAAYRQVFAAAGEPRKYSNPWISLDAFRRSMLEAYQSYIGSKQFARALTLLEGFRPMFSRARTVELTAQAHRHQADALTAQAGKLSDSQAFDINLQAARHFRKAGLTYARLAKMRAATRSYPDDLWNGADNLLSGHDYRNAIKMLKLYLNNESRKRRAQALVGLGKAQLAIGEVDESISSFLECIEFHPRDAAIYQARIWCARAYLESADPDDVNLAEGLLRTNLEGSQLTPASHEWRDSLFALGQLLRRANRHEESIRVLEEAVQRAPQDPQAFEGLYTIAQAYRAAAKEPQERLRNATIESVRLTQRRQIKRLLESAVDYYARVQSHLNRREEAADLTELEKATLRNCYFFVGSVLFDLERYGDAIKAFSDASTRYQSEPLVLEAFVQIAECHRRLGRPIEARGALAQAKVVLKRLPADAAFKKATNYDREEWLKLLDQLATW